MALNLQGKVSLDGSGFEAGIEKMSHKLKDFALEAFGIFTVSEAIKKTVEYADELIDTSNRLGVGTKALQEFAFAARQSGADMEKLTGFVEKLNTSRIDPKKFGAFAKLGISEADLRNLSVENLMMKISSNVSGRSSQEIVGPLREVGGKGAGALIPMLKEDLAATREEAERLGQVMTMQDLVALKAMSDQLKILAQMILVGIAPALTQLGILFLRFLAVLKTARDFLATATRNVSANDAFQAVAALNPVAMARVLTQVYGNKNDAIMAASETAYKSDQEIDRLMARLLKAQQEAEELNAKPDFDSVVPTKKAEKFNLAHPEISKGDALTKVGNFLGTSGRSTIETIGHRHTHLLEKIERNTRAKSSLAGQALDSTFAV